MEKGLVILLLCCAGALIAESMPTEEQERVLELLQQELANAKTSQIHTVHVPLKYTYCN